MMKRALISVSDKTGIVPFAKALAAQGVVLLSTGGTAKRLRDSGLEVTDVSEVTGFPECLDGRVKTLHPKVHGGILARRDLPSHMAQLKDLDIETIDYVVINLYPFKETIEKEGVTLEDAIENIDIGGPTMLRSAAKNYGHVTVVVDPDDYKVIMNELETSGEVSINTKYELALKVFQHTAAYDSMIANYLHDLKHPEAFPKHLTMAFEKVEDLRYGENPHQKAVFYKSLTKTEGTLSDAKQIHGKALSFNNINDANGALDLLKEFTAPTVVAIKHTNPCGVGSGIDLYDAYMKAYSCDPQSIFGGILALNRQVDEKTALEIEKIFIEIVIAPSFSEEALEILTKKKNIRLLVLENIGSSATLEYDIKKVSGGILIQDKNLVLLEKELEVVTERMPTDDEIKALTFAWKVCKHARSNAIVFAKEDQTLSVGPGQVSRIWALENAINNSFLDLKGGVMASDAFFPFNDCVEAAAKAGIKAIIQPGGSKNDQASIDMANQYGIAMVFTGMRHFKH
jgi:phosphoribosylaminoimidazolecarboxamide formyltransferase/IMP cyclohydrolase